jgi:protease IV
MKTSVACLVLAAAVLAAGCGQNMGYIIKPVAISEELGETTVSSDKGLFISDKILVIPVDGLIMNHKAEGFMSSGENPVSLFVEQLDKAAEDPSVKAVVLRINSPGGGVTATDIMYRRLNEFKKTRKVPVIAMIEDVGASGGYYLACGSDVIMAEPTSVTGSIGVIVETFSVAGTMEKLGITAKAITSGPMKDMGSPFKPLDPADQKVLQSLVTEFYGGFLGVVAKGRPNLAAEKIKELADGRIYTGMQAKANGLVDDLGDMKDAIALAKKHAGLKTAKVVMYSRSWGQPSNVYSAAPVGGMQVNLLNLSVPDAMNMLRPQFLYLWTGDAGGSL